MIDGRVRRPPPRLTSALAYVHDATFANENQGGTYSKSTNAQFETQMAGQASLVVRNAAHHVVQRPRSRILSPTWAHDAQTSVRMGP